MTEGLRLLYNKSWPLSQKHGNERFLDIILSTGFQCKLLSNHFITLFFWSLITLTSSYFLPYFPSISLSVPHPPLFSTFWHLLDSDKQGSKYLASLLLSIFFFSCRLLWLSLPALHGFSSSFLADPPLLFLSELLSLSTFSPHCSSEF